MSTQIDLGPVLSIPKGDWNASTTYERLNLVRHNSAAWICNVDTSIGVEPSEDSADWFLQVKDTSAVSSVNGMRGDVEITTIQTPSNDSNDTSIANTEWVRDRLDETINSTHSYTNNAISTATTSILNTAAQDASSKATIAANQALAASETKFATKETANNLASGISTLTEHNAAQDTAIDGKLDKSGGTMEGGITFDTPNGKACILYTSPEQFRIGVGTLASSAQAGVLFDCYTRQHESRAGYLSITSNNGSQSSSFSLQPTGAYVDDKKVLTSAGGTMEGVIYNPTFMRNNLSGQIKLYGGTTGSNGAYIALYGQSCTEGYGNGKVLLRAANKGTTTDVTIDPGKGMYVAGKEVLCIASEGYDNNGNWYRKTSDGLIIQCVHFSHNNSMPKAISLPIPFKDTNFWAMTSDLYNIHFRIPTSNQTVMFQESITSTMNYTLIALGY